MVAENMTNLMLVGKEINKIVATGDLNTHNGANVEQSTTFGTLITVNMYDIFHS